MKNKNLREEKGITLVALVITIVVLLILATVAITMLTGENNIITKAQNAKENYSEASINEEIKIADYENKIDQYIPKTLSPTDIAGTYYCDNDGTKTMETYFTLTDQLTLVYNDTESDQAEGTYTISGNTIYAHMEQLNHYSLGLLTDVNTILTYAEENGKKVQKSFIAGGSDSTNYWVIEGLSEGTKICLE